MRCKRIILFVASFTCALGMLRIEAIAQKPLLAEEVYPRLDSLYKSESYKECIRLETEILAAVRSRKDTLAAAMYFLLGDSYFLAGDKLRALPYYEQELVIRRDLGQAKTTGFSNGLYNLTFLYSELGEYAKAKKTGEELLQCDAQLKGVKSAEYIASLLFVLEVLERSGDYVKAKQLAEQGLLAAGDEAENIGLVMSKLADIYTSMGLYSKAEPLFKEAIKMITEKEGASSFNLTNTIINLSSLYRNQGRYPEAEDLLTSSITSLRSMKNEEAVKSIATALNNLALVQQALSQYTDAEASLREVLDFDKSTYGPKHPYYATSMANLGSVLFENGQTQEGETMINSAVGILKQSGENQFSYAVKINNLANIYRLAGNAEKAIPYYEEARNIFTQKAGTTSADYATTVFNLGQAYSMLNHPLAGTELETALKLRTELFGKSHPKYGEVTRKLATYWWQKNDFTKASQFYSETFKNYFEQIDAYFPALSEDQKSKFYVGKLKLTFEEYYSFSVRYAKEHPEMIGKMYDHQLRTKAMIMYATLKVRNAILQSGDSVLIKSYNQWIEQKELLAKLFSQGGGSALETKQKIDSLTKESVKREKFLTTKSSEFLKTFKPTVYSWKDVKKVLKDGEAAVEIIRFRAYSPEKGGSLTGKIQYAFLIVTAKTKTNPELVMLDNARPQETLFLNFYRNNILAKESDTISYGSYWAHLNKALKGYKKIYWSADGVYNQINVSTLTNPKTGKYLLNEFDIETVTNTKELIERKSSASKARKSFLIGFPRYNKSKQKGEVKKAEGRGMRSSLMRYLDHNNAIPELPETRTEIDNIKQMFTGDAPVETVMEAAATETMIKSLKSPKILHIATHGFFLEDILMDKDESASQYVDNPLLRSGLIMAGAGDFLQQGERNESGDDGILSAYEVMNLNLDDTELVVLSACETGLGTVHNGEGVYGLQRAFQIAGAKSLVMSLWNVDDTATRDLMVNFYQELLKTGDRVTSFRVAQEKLKENYKVPYYWGAFIMVSD